MIPIAIIEDNTDLLDDLQFNLKRLNFQVSAFVDGATLDSALTAGQEWSVLVLDLGLPGEDGLSIARRLRQTHPALGIVALTARGRLSDRIKGLNEGVDLYLVKPVDIAELAAAIRAVARRVTQIEVHCPVWRLETLGHLLVRPDGEQVSLTVTEFQLMSAMAGDNSRPVSRDNLIRAIGRNPDAYDPRALEVCLSRLRAKLGSDDPIKAVRNLGYCFEARLHLHASA